MSQEQDDNKTSKSTKKGIELDKLREALEKQRVGNSSIPSEMMLHPPERKIINQEMLLRPLDHAVSTDGLGQNDIELYSTNDEERYKKQMDDINRAMIRFDGEKLRKENPASDLLKGIINQVQRMESQLNDDEELCIYMHTSGGISIIITDIRCNDPITFLIEGFNNATKDKTSIIAHVSSVHIIATCIKKQVEKPRRSIGFHYDEPKD